MKILVSLMAILMLFSMLSIGVVAEETDTLEKDLILSEEEIEAIGATPDKPLAYGLKRFGENVKLFFAFNKVAKTKLELELAKNRLLETRAMIKMKKLEYAGKAQEAHAKILERVRTRIQEIKAENPEKELEQKLEIEEELLKHEEDIEKVETEIEIEIKEDLSAEEQEQIDTLIDSFKENVKKVGTELEGEENKLRIKIQAVTEKTDEEMKQLIEEKREMYQEAREKRATLTVKRFEKVVYKAEERIEVLESKNINTTGLKEKISISKSLLTQAMEFKESEDYKNLRETLREATALSKEARAGKPFDETGRARAAAVITQVIARKQAADEAIRKIATATITQAKVENAIQKLTAVRERLQKVKVESAEDIKAFTEGIAEKLTATASTSASGGAGASSTATTA